MEISANVSSPKRKIIYFVIMFLIFLFLIVILVFLYFLFNKWTSEKKKITRKEKLDHLHQLLENEEKMNQEISNFENLVKNTFNQTSHSSSTNIKKEQIVHSSEESKLKENKEKLFNLSSDKHSEMNLQIDEEDQEIIQEKLNLENILSSEQLSQLKKMSSPTSIPNYISQIHNVMIVVDENNIAPEKERIPNPLNVPSKIEEID